MPHAVTQSCVGDGSCVFACPVNCIQPSPDDPAFETTDMLYIDPVTCVDCGACTTACPVDAIKPDWQLTQPEQAFLQINSAYHEQNRRERPPLAPIPAPLAVRRRPDPIRVAIVGSGPAAMYAADELLTIPGAQVDIYERLDRPFGLVHSGVAPDHRRTRRVTRQLERITGQEGLSLHLGVQVGRDLTHEQLLQDHHAVIYAVGAASDRKLNIPGEELPGVASAREFVGWYNGHPDFSELPVDLSHQTAVVIGNGNVALDIARILASDPDSLQTTEIDRSALAALRSSQINEVLVVGRRGPGDAAFTVPELVGLKSVPGATAVIDQQQMQAGSASGDLRYSLLGELPSGAASGRTIDLRFGLSPIAIEGNGKAQKVIFERRDPDPATGVYLPTGQTVAIEAGLVITSVGFTGNPIGDLPFDTSTGTVPNDQGRVLAEAGQEPVENAYVVGWIKRGATGFIGTNKLCAQQTVATLIDDYNSGVLKAPQMVAAG